jgi:hypothetical protein
MQDVRPEERVDILERTSADRQIGEIYLDDGHAAKRLSPYLEANAGLQRAFGKSARPTEKNMQSSRYLGAD